MATLKLNASWRPITTTLRPPTRAPRALSSRSPVLASSSAPRRTLTTTPRSHNDLTHSSTAHPFAPLSRALPRGTWDSHMHILSPDTTRFPFRRTSQYTPTPHTIADAARFYAPLGIRNLVFVQPSPYADDNACLLEGMREWRASGGQARGVVQVEPGEARTEEGRRRLKGWHGLGVRGVRVNLKSVGRRPGRRELEAELRAYAEVVEEWGWVLQVYLGLEMVPALEEVVRTGELEGVRWCVDHLGHPTVPEGEVVEAPDPYRLEGFESLVRLLRAGNTWTKCSAAYRIEKDPRMPWVGAMARELLKVAPDQVVFATDWPHTRFDGVDVRPFIEKCFEWCGGDEKLVEKLFKRNAERLWDAETE